MSYCAQVSFKQMPIEDIEGFCEKIKQTIKDKEEEVVEADCVFSPFSRHPQEDEHKNFFATIKWAQDIFTYRAFTLRRDNEVIFCVAGLPDCVEKLFDATVYFQNSTDQDYEFETWDNVPWFKEIADKHRARTDADEYHRKTDCYDEIWAMLDDKVFESGLDIRLFSEKSDFHWLSTFASHIRTRYKEKYGA